MREPGTPKKPTGILDSSSSAAAAALKPGQCSANATETVTMPAVCTNGAGPSKPAFHPGLGVKGIILPPPDTSEPKQSAKSAAKAPTGTGTVGVVSTASAGKKFSYTEKRSAGWILQRHVGSTGSNRSADWLKKVEWAKTVLPDFDMQSPRALDQAKRQRSQEAPGPSAKKSRVQQGRSFAQIAKERVLVGVLDQGNAAIPRNQWKWVETALATACFELLEQEPGPPPVCKDVGWFQGNVKVIACDDERSAELYKTAVSNIGEVYPGAKLVAVNWKDVPVRPRARLWIPSSIKEPERLLKMLQRCNPGLPTHDWKVAKIEEMPGPTNQAVMILNKESLAPIDAAGGELNFGFSSVHIRVYKSDATPCDHLSEKPSEEEITDLEAPERPELDGYTSDASTITRDLSALCNMGEMELTSDVASDDEDANTTVVEAASAALLLRLAGNGADIALIQEPWIVGGKVSGLRAPEYKLVVAESQGYLKKEDDTWTTSSEESLDALLTKHFPGCRQQKTDNLISPQEKSQATPGKINIYSDSQAAIKSIASTTSKSTSVSKCRRSLHEMAELFDICLVWVPGHQDIQGNCIADELARRGTTDTLLPDKEDISMPLATCKLMLHNLFEEKHNVQWYSTPNCRVARQTWPHIDKARSKTLCNLSRTDCSRVVRSITGHWLVGVHALRLKAPYNDFCRSCRDEEEEESPEHFFCFCPALSNRRRRALGKPFLTSLGELATLAPSRIALFVKLSNWAPF
ncbi:hypothetical protein ACLKA7_001239 [Drosophila subpalustris]